MKVILPLSIFVFTTAGPAAAMSLAEAMSVCESFVATEVIPDSITIDPASVSEDRIDAFVETELGPLSIRFSTNMGPDLMTDCALLGTNRDAPKPPFDVTVREGLPVAKRWMEERAAATGGTLYGVGAEWAFTICAPDGERWVLLMYASMRDVPEVADEDMPIFFQVRSPGTSSHTQCPP